MNDPSTRTVLEQRLIDDLANGEVTDCEGSEVSALFLRALISGNLEDAQKRDGHGLRLSNARVEAPLDLDNLTVDVPLSFRECTFLAGVSLRFSRIRSLALSGCTCMSEGIVLDAEGAQISGDLILGGFSGAATGGNDCVRVVGAKILGELDCRGAKLASENGYCFNAVRLQLDGYLYLSNGFEASTTGNKTAVRLRNARVGAIDVKSATIRSSGNAINMVLADVASIARFEYADISSTRTAMRLTGAKFGAGLFFSESRIFSSSGSGISARNSTLVQGLGFSNCVVESRGARRYGANFFRVEADFFACFRSRFDGDSEGLIVEGAAISGDFDIDSCAVISRSGGYGAVISNADIRGTLQLGNRSNPPSDVATSVCLCGTRVANFHLDKTFRPTKERWLCLTDFEYNTLPVGRDFNGWIDLLANQTSDYSMQPWQQLANTYRKGGYEREARLVLIGQQERHRIFVSWLPAGASLSARLQRRLWSAQRNVIRVTTGYGYQSWRAAIGLFGTVTTAVVLAFFSGQVHADVPASAVYVAQHSRLTSDEGSPCSEYEKLAMGLQIGLPLIGQSVSQRCSLNTASRAGQIINTVAFIIQLVAWAFATLMVAGYTGLIRRL